MKSKCKSERGYQSSIWATYAQWQHSARVRKGEESAFIVFWTFDGYAAAPSASATTNSSTSTSKNNSNGDEQERRWHCLFARYTDNVTSMITDGSEYFGGQYIAYVVLHLYSNYEVNLGGA